MAKDQETELKLRLLNSEAWQGILASPLLKSLAKDTWRRQTLTAQYFDTENHSLQAAGLTYRIRRENDAWVATVKTAGQAGGGLHSRQEWNAVLTDNIPVIEPFMKTAAGPQLAAAVGEQALMPLVATAFERYALDVHMPDGSQIEIALDNGRLIAGEDQEAVQEIELELKEGNPAALLLLGAELAREFPLLVEPRSKYQRAIVLAGLTPDDREKAKLPELSGGQPAGEALAAVLISCIQRVLACQEEFIRNPDDPESLHQLRLKLRRLRSVLAFAKPFMAEQDYSERQSVLREWGQMFSPLRDLDVLTAHWDEVLTTGNVSFGGKPWLGDILAEERRQLIGEVLEKIALGQSTPMFLSLWAWLADTPWSGTQQAVSSREYTVDRLAGWIDGLVKDGRQLDWADEAAVHALRIKIKKIRYSLKAMAFMAGPKSGKLIVRLKEMQDVLGCRRDTQIIMGLIDQIIKNRSSRAVHRDAGILKGWQARASLDIQQFQGEKWNRLQRTCRKWLKIVD